MVLSHKHKFIFICNGKTGTSSIEATLQSYQEGIEFNVGVKGLYTAKHVPPVVLRSQLGSKIWNEYFVFAFVRNPWDWFVSQYFWNHKPDPVSKKKLICEPTATLREYQRKREKLAQLENLNRFSPEDIQETYNTLLRYRGIYQADSLFQYHYIYSPNSEKLVDFVGRFERIEEDFALVMERVGLAERLPHRNATNHKDYREYYTEETAGLVEKLYRIDIETFSYKNPFRA